MQDIPKLYTALAEWLACLVYILLLKKRFDRYRTASILAAALPLICILQYYIGVLPVTFWIPLMIVAMLFMYGLILLCCRVTCTGAAFCFSLAFITAEFVASLEWQLYSFFAAGGWNSWQVRLAFLALFYSCLFAVIYMIEKKYLSKEKRLTVSVRSAGGFLLSAIAVFLMSNVSYVYSNTPFSGTGGNEVFYIRTLVDFAGLILLIAQQDRLREIQLEKELAATNTILLRQYEQYQQSKESIELVNQKYHDLKHQIAVIRAEQDEEKRNTYLEEMESGIHMYEAQNKTGNSVLDTILTGKNMYCVQHNINFTCVADGSLIDFMDTMDICTIFGNALDNAIESVEKIEDAGKRIIKTAVFAQNGFLMIRFENYFESKINMKDSFPVTTKKNQEYHGFGLKSIKKITEKYGGTITIHAEDQWFTLRILIPMAGKQ